MGYLNEEHIKYINDSLEEYIEREIKEMRIRITTTYDSDNGPSWANGVNIDFIIGDEYETNEPVYTKHVEKLDELPNIDALLKEYAEMRRSGEIPHDWIYDAKGWE